MHQDALGERMSSSMSSPTPTCQWSFDQSRRFHHLGGDSAALFHRAPADLLRRPVAIIDDPHGTWAGCLDRLFSGKTPVERWNASLSGVEYTLIQIALPDADGAIPYCAGFACDAGQPLPEIRELEFAARGVLQVLETERARTTRFLHDVVAQCLSGAGLQIELMQLELPSGHAGPPDRAANVQRALEEALQQVREFSGKAPMRPFTRS
jgi:hypothetical protein